MKRHYLLCLLALLPTLTFAQPLPKPTGADAHEPNITEPYGRQLCDIPGYHCVLVSPSATWDTLWPVLRERQIILRLNRTNLALHYRKWVVVPNNLAHATVMSVSPFPQLISPPKQKIIIVNSDLQAYGVYNKTGHLLFWGPATLGRNWCPDIKKPCQTVRGIFRIFRKGTGKCVSHTFPVDTTGNGTPMPYCMFFHKGFAFHGAEVPGFPSTHGCVGIYNNDARWINNMFVKANAKTGTLIMVLK